MEEEKWCCRVYKGTLWLWLEMVNKGRREAEARERDPDSLYSST